MSKIDTLIELAAKYREMYEAVTGTDHHARYLYEWAYERWYETEQQICDEVEQTLLHGVSYTLTHTWTADPAVSIYKPRRKPAPWKLSYFGNKSKSPRTRMEDIELFVPSEEDRIIESVEQAFLRSPGDPILEEIARSLALPKELIMGGSNAPVADLYLQLERERQERAYQQLLADLSVLKRAEVKRMEKEALPVQILPELSLMVGIDPASESGDDTHFAIRELSGRFVYPGDEVKIDTQITISEL